jgi:O-acetyl-ADP-ribose deacetylase (regulator of RNase III)
MIIIKQDITTVKGPALIAHGVNCQKAMGSGVARALFEKWPGVRTQYIQHGSQQLGDVQFVVPEGGEYVIANCFTQVSYGRDPNMRYANPASILCTLLRTALFARQCLNLDRVHIPRIGCGLGGLDWSQDVEPLIHQIEARIGIDFVVCDL